MAGCLRKIREAAGRRDASPTCTHSDHELPGTSQHQTTLGPRLAVSPRTKRPLTAPAVTGRHDGASLTPRMSGVRVPHRPPRFPQPPGERMPGAGSRCTERTDRPPRYGVSRYPRHASAVNIRPCDSRRTLRGRPDGLTPTLTRSALASTRSLRLDRLRYDVHAIHRREASEPRNVSGWPTRVLAEACPIAEAEAILYRRRSARPTWPDSRTGRWCTSPSVSANRHAAGPDGDASVALTARS